MNTIYIYIYIYIYIILYYIYIYSVVILLFEHSPSRVSEIEYFEIFSHPQENKLAQRFFVKFNFLLFFLISNVGSVYAYTDEYKHKHNVSYS